MRFARQRATGGSKGNKEGNLLTALPHAACLYGACSIHLLALRACTRHAPAHTSSKRKRVGPSQSRNEASGTLDPLARAACLYGGRASAHKLEAQASGSVKVPKRRLWNRRKGDGGDRVLLLCFLCSLLLPPSRTTLHNAEAIIASPLNTQASMHQLATRGSKR